MFAAYNVAVWPAQFVLLVIALSITALVIWAPNRAGPPAAFGLAFLWAWMGLVYHLGFFWRINPAAPWFALISLAAATAFAWIGGSKKRLQFERRVTGRTVAGVLVVVFALVVYPLLGMFIGHDYPASPTFGLPCPTTLFTFGVLLMAAPNGTRVLVVAPLLWAVIGASAAFVLGVPQDLSLLAVVVLGVYMLFRRTSPGCAGDG